MLAALVVALAGCGREAGSTAPPSPRSTPTAATAEPTPRSTPTPMSTPTPGPSPASAASEPILSGDAETNEACRLATPTEVSEQVGAGVLEVRGLTAPGAYGETGLSCTWYLDSDGIGIPSVGVQWEFPVTTWHDSVVELYGQFVDQGLAVDVPDLGDAAMVQGATVETVDRDRIVRVTVLMHPEPTEADIANAVALLRLMLGRTHELLPVAGG